VGSIAVVAQHGNMVIDPATLVSLRSSPRPSLMIVWFLDGHCDHALIRKESNRMELSRRTSREGDERATTRDKRRNESGFVVRCLLLVARVSLVITHRISFVCVAPTTIMWHSSTGHSFRVLVLAVSLCLALLVVSSSGEAELILPSDTCWYGIARAPSRLVALLCVCG